MAKYSDQERIGVVDFWRSEFDVVLRFFLGANKAPGQSPLTTDGTVRIIPFVDVDTDTERS
jgi:hypothetical protein